MPKSSRKLLGKREIPSLSILFAEHMLASIGDFVTADIYFRSVTITVLITISKTGQLTFPISGHHRYGFARASQIASSRNSWIPLISCYRQNPITIRIPRGFISDLYPASTSRTNGHLWTVLALRKYWRHQQNCGIVGAQSANVMDMVVLWTLSMNRKRIGKRSAVSKG